MLSDTLIQKLRSKRTLPPPDFCRDVRIAAGASQADIAEALGVHRETVSRWERGERKPNEEHRGRYLAILEELRKIPAAMGVLMLLPLLLLTAVTGRTRQLRTLAQVLDERPWTTEPWLRRLVKERRVPFFKAGGKLLFDLGDLDDFAERGRVEPPAPFVALTRDDARPEPGARHL